MASEDGLLFMLLRTFHVYVYSEEQCLFQVNMEVEKYIFLHFMPILTFNASLKLELEAGESVSVI